MRVASEATVVIGLLLATVSLAASSDKVKKEQTENLDKLTKEDKEEAQDMLYHMKEMKKELSKKKKETKAFKWESISNAKKLQDKRKMLVVVRIDPIDDELEKRMEMLAAEFKARNSQEIIWIKRSPPTDDFPLWLQWEEVPVSTRMFAVLADFRKPSVVYKGEDTFTAQLNWLMQVFEAERPQMLLSVSQVEAFMDAAPVSIIASIPVAMSVDGKYLKFLKKLSTRHPYLPIGIVYPEDVEYTEMELRPFTLFYRDEDMIQWLDEQALQELDDFSRDVAIKNAARPVVMNFPEDAVTIFNQGIDKIVLLFDFPPLKRGQMPDYVKKLALQYRQQVVVAYVDMLDKTMDGVKKAFGVETIMPTVRAFNHWTEMQYWPEKPHQVLFPHNLRKFVKDLVENNVPPHRRVEEIPAEVNEGKSVVQLNAETLPQRIAAGPFSHLLIFFYANWCPHSKRFEKKFAAAAEESKGKREVVFAKFDADKNDVDLVRIRTFPTVMLMKKGKQAEGITYFGRRNTIELLEWLDKEIEEKQSEPEGKVRRETRDGRESPLEKKVKGDHEQKYTIEGLDHGDIGEKKKTKMTPVNEILAAKVLEKLKVDKPTIVSAIERSKRGGEEGDDGEKKRGTAEKDIEGEKKKKMGEGTVSEKKKKVPKSSIDEDPDSLEKQKSKTKKTEL